jgi:predicted  nucleic acid-binding Zn-ribbon protein
MVKTVNNQHSATIDDVLAAVNTFADETHQEFSNIKGEISGIKTKISGIDVEISGIKGEISGIKCEITGIKGEISGIKTKISGIDVEISGIKGEITGIKDEISEINGKLVTVVTKSYLDEKLVDLSGDLVILTRKEDNKLKALVGVLKEKAVLTSRDVKKIYSMEPFAQ